MESDVGSNVSVLSKTIQLSPSDDNIGDRSYPMVFQCVKCKEIIGDSISWICANEDLRSVTLERTKIPLFSQPCFCRHIHTCHISVELGPLRYDSDALFLQVVAVHCCKAHLVSQWGAVRNILNFCGPPFLSTQTKQCHSRVSRNFSVRHFGISADMSGQFSTGAEVSYAVTDTLALILKCLGSEVFWV